MVREDVARLSLGVVVFFTRSNLDVAVLVTRSKPDVSHHKRSKLEVAVHCRRSKQDVVAALFARSNRELVVSVAKPSTGQSVVCVGLVLKGVCRTVRPSDQATGRAQR